MEARIPELTTMSPIVRAFWGGHIDLSKIVSVSDAYFINRMSSGGYFVGFQIHCQLLDTPIEHVWDISHFGLKSSETGGGVRSVEIVGPESEEALQKDIDNFVEQWKEFNNVHCQGT